MTQAYAVPTRATFVKFRHAVAQVLANPSLRRLQIAWIAAVAAEKAFLVALLVYAYDVGGVAAVGVFTLLASLPAGLFGPILSSVADAFPPVRVLLALHLGRALVVGVAALAVFAELTLGILVAATLAEGILTRQHTASTRALLPSLSRTPDELISGNGITSLGEAIGALVGPAVAGVLLLVGGPVLGLALPAVAYLVAGAVVLAIDVRPTTTRDLDTATTLGRLLETLGGFQALRRHASAGLLVSLFISQTFVRGLLTVLIVSAAIDLLGIGDAGVGYLNAAIGAGGLVGALLAIVLVVNNRLSLSFAASLGLWGLPIAVIGLLPVTPVAFVMAAVIGAANASVDVAGYTLLARCVPNEVRGRVFGVLQSLVGIGVAAGAIAAPVLVEAVGLQAALIVTGLILPALAVIGFTSVQRAEAAAILPERELAVMRAMPMFAPLPLTELEQLARSLDPVTFAPGERIITQGEPGDCFYMIERGTVEIVHDGHRETTLGPGDGFGEIALLSDRPRTATVAALEAVDGFRLPRHAFLEALTGSPHGTLAAEELASRRLAELGHPADSRQ